jgi:predicted DNA-binding protein YlxM (UPF0122 family)
MYQLYIVEEKSLSEIARIVRCSRSTVYSRLKKFDIPQKSKREKPLDRSILDDPERMNQLYVVEEKSAAEIAKMANCNITTVYSRLKKFGIERHRYIPQKSKREKPLDRSILDDPERMNQLFG